MKRVGSPVHTDSVYVNAATKAADAIVTSARLRLLRLKTQEIPEIRKKEPTAGNVQLFRNQSTQSAERSTPSTPMVYHTPNGSVNDAHLVESIA